MVVVMIMMIMMMMKMMMMMGDSVVECPLQRIQFCNIFQSGDQTQKGTKLHFTALPYTMGR